MRARARQLLQNHHLLLPSARHPLLWFRIGPRAKKRLQRRRHDCAGSDELLARVRGAEADLDRWFEMEGRRAGMGAELAALRGELAAQAAALSQARRWGLSAPWLRLP
jgi:hypothetical protein